MKYTIKKITVNDMVKYAEVSITFMVEKILEPISIDNGLGGIRLIEKEVESYIKEYDAIGSGPNGWHNRFDTTNWVRFVAVDENGEFIGGVTVAFNTDKVNMLEGRDDMTVLWDIRIHPDFRHKGIGRELFSSALQWSGAKGCTMMKIETQNININACRFYSAMGCRLGAIRKHVYQEESCRNEVQLLWYYDL